MEKGGEGSGQLNEQTNKQTNKQTENKADLEKYTSAENRTRDCLHTKQKPVIAWPQYHSVMKVLVRVSTESYTLHRSA